MRHASVGRVASAGGEGSIAAQLVHSLFAYERLDFGRPQEEAVSGGSPANNAVGR